MNNYETITIKKIHEKICLILPNSISVMPNNNVTNYLNNNTFN